jgi:MFS family permease
MLLAFSSSYGQTFFIAAFAGQIRTDYQLSHGEWGAIYTVATLMSAAVMFSAGGLTDRYRVRTVGALTLSMLAVACVAMALAWNVASLIVAVFALRLFGQGMASHTAVVGAARWFVATRGKALAITVMGVALGEAILPIGAVTAMSVLPWRSLWLLAAAAALAAALLLALMLSIERTPQSMPETSQSTGMSGRHWTRKEAFSHPLMWLTLPLVLAPPVFNTALFFQQVHVAEVKGISHVAFVGLFPVYVAASILFMALSGWAVDRWGATRLLPLYGVPFALGFLVLAMTDGWAGIFVAMLTLGAAQGAHSTIPTAFWAESWGTRNIGSIRAGLSAIMVFGTALGPLGSGFMIDLGMNFAVQSFGIAAWMAVAAALAGFAVVTSRSTATKKDVERP